MNLVVTGEMVEVERGSILLSCLQNCDVQAWNTLLSTLKVSSSIGVFLDKDYVEQEQVEGYYTCCT